MANKLKKPNKPDANDEKPAKAVKSSKVVKDTAEKLKSDRDEKVDLRKLAKDERTWKIIGTVSLLTAIFLFIAFVSYLFTWQSDQSKVWGQGLLFLINNNAKVDNLLGRLGAFTSHFFIRNGFGLASFLFCTFFFVAGINLLFERKVFSIWRNLKYVTIGLLIVSVSLAFIFSGAGFPFGGAVGHMISVWLVNFLGTFGTAALLLVVGISYLIWQFNPTFNLPQRSVKTEEDSKEPESDNELNFASAPANNVSINDLYANDAVTKPNALKGEGGMVLNMDNGSTKDINLGIVERDELNENELTINQPLIEKEMVNDLLHISDMDESDELPVEENNKETKKNIAASEEELLELEIKTADSKRIEEEETNKTYSDLPPYEPTL
ncbi:MAG TPA: DNA translocase FtsK 4TM domain-containing protein, partial [Flavisolibacter sp.]|nr:DNA translocase FtsK 4TM domain-containing protein [Flavisolibacter sp.]